MLFLVILILLFLAILDASFSSFLISSGMYILGVIVVLIYQRENRKKCFLLYNIIFSVYLLLTFLVSISFSEVDWFLVFDPSNYIDYFLNSTEQFWLKDDIFKCYFEFADNNALHNAYLNAVAVFINKNLGGLTVYGLTLFQTIFGVLSSIVLFGILARRFDKNRAFNYTLFFALSSLFLFYSTVIIRDIIICFLYLLAFNIVDQKFTLSGVIKLIIIIVITWGVRLYSGIFLFVFLGYYIYIRMRNSKFRNFANIFFILLLIIVGGYIFTTDLFVQTTEELNFYAELTTERSEGGLTSKLQTLPPGISHLTIVLFSMIRPLPPFSIYIGVETFSHFLMSTMFLVAGFFWFVIFYSLCCQLFFSKYIFKISVEKIVLLLLCLVFMLVNAMHPDIRRMLPVFPILFVQFLEICKAKNVTLFGSELSKALMILYIVMAFGMLVIM
ncbi:MAG: hypothetical protein U0L22_05720 [Bacteroidales bacterium]|nr:hypothetical protein [Bacteroidales bacterium]